MRHLGFTVCGGFISWCSLDVLRHGDAWLGISLMVAALFVAFAPALFDPAPEQPDPEWRPIDDYLDTHVAFPPGATSAAEPATNGCAAGQTDRVA